MCIFQQKTGHISETARDIVTNMKSHIDV